MLNNRMKIFLTALLLLLSIPGSSSGMDHEHTTGNVRVDCYPDKGPCVKTIEDRDVQIVFDIIPKPVRVMTDLVFTIAVKKSAEPVTDADVTLDLTMPGMFMGMNRPPVKHMRDGMYEGKGVIPACPHGGKIWKAEVTVKRDGRSETVSYIFEVK